MLQLSFINVNIIDPIHYTGWNDLLLTNPASSFFHTSNWANVLHSSYGYSPNYFTSVCSKRLEALIPVMEVHSFLTGKRGVSLPFSDYCEPIFAENVSIESIMNEIIEYGHESGWDYVEFRDGEHIFHDVPVYSVYRRHTIDLNRNDEIIYTSFRDSTKRNLRKAGAEGVTVTFHDTRDAIKEFYRLNCITRRLHGLPPQPFLFFENIHEHVISKNLGFVALASYKGNSVSGAVFFHHGGKSLYKYGASDKRYQHLRANNLVIWETIRRYCRNGYQSFCFGRTDPENKGLIQFKAGYGTKDETLHYYRYDLRKEIFIKGNAKNHGRHQKIFYGMPLSMLKIIGSLMYKHMG